jgi:hypothetical protein
VGATAWLVLSAGASAAGGRVGAIRRVTGAFG